MRIEPVGRVRCQTSLWRSGGVLRVTAIVKATFAFVEDDVARQIDPAAIGLRDKHVDNNPRRSTFESFEMAPYVPGVGVTLVGTAYPPAGNATPSMSVRLGIYHEDTPVLEKTLHVFGERLPEDPRVSRPLTPMPLVYERAIGGRVNLAGSSLYNVVSPSDASRPGCFAPIPLAWRALGGRGLDPHAMKASPVEIPEGFDFGFFSSAPYDQRLRSLRGDEWILLDGMSGRAPRVQTRLPSAQARALFRSRMGTVWSPATEVPLALDSVVIDAEDESVSLLWRGHLAVDERTDDVYVLAGIDLQNAPLAWPRPEVESSAVPPRPAASTTAVTSPRPASTAPSTEAPPTQATSSGRPLSSVPPAMGDDGGIFETVVGTIDEILASMPALPFEPAAPPEKHALPGERSAPPSRANPIPATPWDGGPASGDVAAASRTVAPFDVEETMDVTAVRRLLGGPFEDLGTVVSSEAVSSSQPLPFKATTSNEPVRKAPLGVPSALPFEERSGAPHEPVAEMARPQRAKAQTLHSATERPLPPALVRPSPAIEVRSFSTTPDDLPPPPRERISTLEIVLPTTPTLGAPPSVASGVARVDARAEPIGSATPPRASEPLEAEESATDTSALVPLPVDPALEPSTSEATNLPSTDSIAAEFEAAAQSSGSPRDSVMGPPDAAAKLRKEVQSRLARNASLSDLSLVGVNLAGLDLSGRNLSGLDLTGANLTRCVLKGTRLSRAKLEGASLSFASAEEADFENADLRRATLEGARLTAARLTSADFSLASAQKASFEGVTGRGARFVETKLEGADFSRADLVEVDFTKAIASRARFEGARLVDGSFSDFVGEASNLDRADVTRGNFEGAVLRRAYFVGTNAADTNLENADLTNARCSRAVFDRANLERTVLEGADFTGASLQKARLKAVNAAGARFDGARLDEADLRLSKLNDASLIGATLVSVQAGRADLSKADLSKADLQGANFRSARLGEASLVGAIIDRADFRDAYLVRADLTGVDRESARFAGANLDGVEGFTSG